MFAKTVAIFLYAIAGSVFLIAGASVLMLGTGLLPEAIRKIVLDIGRNDGNSLHLMQEFGSLMVFAGLITFWFIAHYQQSRAFHWAMTTFWALFALIHWVDIRGSFELDIGSAINSIPFVLFLAVGLLREVRVAGKQH